MLTYSGNPYGWKTMLDRLIMAVCILSVLYIAREVLTMAKVTGPLFSQEARGQFAQTAVFNRRRGQNIVRSYVIPANPMTANQIIQRIKLAAVGIITRRVRATDWKYAAVAQTIIEFYQGRTRTGEVWNSALGREMFGPGNATYDARLQAYNALTDPQKDMWEEAAETVVTALTNYTRGETTVERGFMLFLVQGTVAAAGYGPDFNPFVPIAVVAG